MLWNSTEILVRERVPPHAPSSHDGVHTIALEKQGFLWNDLELNTQSGDGRLSENHFIDLTKSYKSSAASLFRSESEKYFDLKTATTNSTSASTPDLMDLELSFWKMIREDFRRNALHTWYASHNVLSDHNSSKKRSKCVRKEELTYSDPKKKILVG